MRRLVSVVVALSASAALAQTSGTVRLNGNVGKAASVRYFQVTPLAGSATTGLNAPNAQDSVLDTTITLGDLSPTVANNGVAQGAAVQLILRSNATYTLSSAITAQSGFGVGAGDLSLADFGYGINSATKLASGNGNLSTATTGVHTVTAAYDNNGLQSGTDANGLPTYSATLASVNPGPVVVMTGDRISNKGGLNNPNNGLLIDSIYSVLPQYYTPTLAFSATVTYTIATP